MDSGSTKTGSDELKSVFETHLAEAGQMPFGLEEGDGSKGQVSKSNFQCKEYLVSKTTKTLSHANDHSQENS